MLKLTPRRNSAMDFLPCSLSLQRFLSLVWSSVWIRLVLFFWRIPRSLWSKMLMMRLASTCKVSISFQMVGWLWSTSELICHGHFMHVPTMWRKQWWSRQSFPPPLSVAIISILLGVLEYHLFILYIVHDDSH